MTPYLVDGTPTVTSTLAFVAKAAAIRARADVTLTAGGLTVAGEARVGVDPTPRWFDRNVRDQELAKYPPSRAILRLPGHRRLLPWYVSRIVMSIDPLDVVAHSRSDRATLSVVDPAGRLHTVPVPVPAPDDLTAAERLGMPADLPDGPAVLLVHEEDARQTDLRQLALHGRLADGELVVQRRGGTLAPSVASPLAQVAQLRRLARQAAGNRAVLATWPAPEDEPGAAGGGSGQSGVPSSAR